MERSTVGFLVPFYFFLLGLIILFSLILLFQGITGVGKEDNMTNTLFVMSGLMGLIVTFYMIRRYQVGIQKMLKSRRMTVVTVEECLKCNYKNIRPFREGDFVYGQGGVCPKCSEDSEYGKNNMLITAIYLDIGAQEEKT